MQSTDVGIPVGQKPTRFCLRKRNPKLCKSLVNGHFGNPDAQAGLGPWRRYHEDQAILWEHPFGDGLREATEPAPDRATRTPINLTLLGGRDVVPPCRDHN